MTSGDSDMLPRMSHEDPLEEVFAPFALRMSCGPLGMRFVRDIDVPEIAAAIHEHGTYSPDEPVPFMRRWAETGNDLAVNTLQHYYDAFAFDVFGAKSAVRDSRGSRAYVGQQLFEG